MITHSLLFRFLVFVPDLSGSASLASKIEALLIESNVKLSAFRKL